MGGPIASPDGQFIYAVGTWSESGLVKNQILRSDDLGTTWCVLATKDPIAEIVPAPSAANVLYAITLASDTSEGILLRTTDAGATWTAQGDKPPEATLEAAFLVVATSDPAVLWLTRISSGRLFLSRDAGRTWTARTVPAPLTIDSGSFAFVDAVVIDRRSPNRVFASGLAGPISMLSSAPSLLGFPRRTFVTGDWGETWSELTLPVTPKFGPASWVSDDASVIYFADETPALWRSTDWGKNWKKGDVIPPDSQPLTTLRSHRPGELFAWPWRSLDGGESWQALSVPEEPPFEPTLAMRDGNVIFGDTGVGMTSTADAGATWQASPTVPDTFGRFDFVSQSPVDPYPLWTAGQFQTGGSNWYPTLRSGDGALTWTLVSVSGGFQLWDGASADVGFSDLGDGIQRTEDGCRTWQPVALPFAPARVLSVAVCAPPISCLYGLFYNENNAAIGTARSDDHGRTWTEPKQIPGGLGHVSFPGPLIVSPDDTRRLFVPCGDRLCESQDGGTSWMYSSLPGPAIVFLPNGVVLAAGTDVRRSTDGWLTSVSVLSVSGSLVQSRAQPSVVFLIPDVGSGGGSPLYRSDDAGLSWRSAAPPTASPWTVISVVDAPGGGFLAFVSNIGLVRFN
jgi:photosystem II stability/assembly factor-like uncharacterized protein